jgi:hypothetical protein
MYASQKMRKVSWELKYGQNRLNGTAAPSFLSSTYFGENVNYFKITRKLAGSIIGTE